MTEPTDVRVAGLVDQLVVFRRRYMSQVDMAKRLGVSQPMVSKLERGHTDPRLSTLERYADALGVFLMVASYRPR